MKKIVVIGPESTGKSTLCAQLAAHYGTLWVPEYARQYLLQRGAAYTYAHMLPIAQGQQALEDAYAAKCKTSSHLFIDTNQYVMKVWSEVVFNNCPSWILQQIAQRRYHLYLLCNVDLPWQPDPLREYPDPSLRRRHLLQYKDLLINDGTPWALVSGTEAERLQNAITAIESLP